MNEEPEYGPKANAFKTLVSKIYLHRLPSYGNKIFYGLGFLALTSLVLLIISGSVLAFMGQDWWLHDPVGIYARSVHLWSVQAFIAILILHILVGFFTSGYRPPRRMVWVFGAAIFALVVFQTEFGYGLRGDFSSQFRAVSGADFWNGARLGYWINPLSHLQEFALHVAIIPLSILGLFVLHYILIHAYGISKPLKKETPYRMVDANHRIMWTRGAFLAAAILVLAFFFHSPYVPVSTIADSAKADASLVSSTLTDEYARTSDTATYLDSIDPYAFDTRTVYVVAPYEALSGATEATTSDAMIAALMPAVENGTYEAYLDRADPAPYTYSLRFLSDMGVLEERAGTLGFATDQWGMAKDENGHYLNALPPGSWWMTPLGVLNSSFNLLNNDNGDEIAAYTFAIILLLFIVFPYVPILNRLPELFPFGGWIQRDKSLSEGGGDASDHVTPPPL
ncbi:MAG: cytochrome b N-terminal domain-containing protein [Patescibacteria group bacterium]|nr:cytochrome b N-terminal domain-containing protein [Patescibacteria group bacterium]MDE1965736.1 cytochrome b N-terminal domain-containing protein [Patescibacteria group bacterium]